MSKQTNNPDSDGDPDYRDASKKQLKEFLDKNSVQADDGFDQEALEGFAMLENEQEAIEIKTALDDRMHNNFFLENKTNLKTYWLAAAGFLLVVGLSVYFISNSSPRQKNLALSENETSGEQTVSTHSSGTALNEKTEEPKKQIPLMISGNVAGNKPEGRTGAKAAKQAEVGFSNNSSKPTQQAPPAAVAGADAITSQDASAPLGKSEMYDIQADADHLEPAHKKSAERLDSAVASEKENNNRKSFINKNDKSQSAGAPARSSANENDNGKLVVAEKSSSNIYYIGGEPALNASLKEKLIKKDCNQKFDALLFINKNAKVEKIILTKTFELSAKQQKLVIEILESLTNFKFHSTPVSSALSEYKVNYRQ